MYKRTKKLMLILTTTLIILLAYGCFLKFHLASDAYRIIDNSNAFILNLKCNEGRLIQVLYFAIFHILSISINSINTYMFLYRINSIISIIMLVLSVQLTFKMLVDNIKNINSHKKIVVFLCTLLLFINVSVCEYMLYFENCIMVLGLLLAIIAARIYHSNIKFKYTIISILILLSSFCYQGVTQIFVLLSALVLFLIHRTEKQTYYLKELLKILLLYLSPLLINYLISWWLNSILPNLDPRLFTGILQSLKQLISHQNVLIITTYIILLAFLILLNPQIFRYEKLKENLLIIFYLMIISIFSFEIFTFNNSSALVPRIMLNFIIIYPILKIYIISLKENRNFIIDIILTIVILIINILLVLRLEISNINSTNLNINVVQSIIEKIENYELDNNVKIENVAFYVDKNSNGKYWNNNPIDDNNSFKLEDFINYTYTVLIYHGYWCDIYSINVLSGKKYNRVNYLEVDEELANYFNSKDWNKPNLEEQIIFKDNTVHICAF